ncbi:MAG: hypothetical protein QW478_00885 [Candidatus Micrarchaeaceae archaeon]
MDLNSFKTGKIDNTIIITAPHSYCVNKSKRDCDILAEEAARYLFKISKFNTYLILSNELREYLDNNRVQGRKGKFRKDLYNIMISNHILFLLDIHSFDENYYEGDVAILDNIPGTNYGHNLFQYLRSKKIYVKYFYGSLINDIVKQARFLHIDSILIEFNENLRPKYLEYICDQIMQWLIQKLS